MSNTFRPGDLYSYEPYTGISRTLYSQMNDLEARTGRLEKDDVLIVISDYPLKDAFGYDCIQLICRHGLCWIFATTSTNIGLSFLSTCAVSDDHWRTIRGL